MAGNDENSGINVATSALLDRGCELVRSAEQMMTTRGVGEWCQTFASFTGKFLRLSGEWRLCFINTKGDDLRDYDQLPQDLKIKALLVTASMIKALPEFEDKRREKAAAAVSVLEKVLKEAPDAN